MSDGVPPATARTASPRNAATRRPTVLALARNTGGFYHGQLLAGIIRQVHASGGRVVVAETLDPEGDGAKTWDTPPAFRLPIAWDEVDVVVAIAVSADVEYLKRLQAEGKPVVRANHFNDDVDCPAVIPGNHGGVRSAVEHLIAHGHTRIGFLGCLDQHDYRERYDSYRATMLDHNLTVTDDLLFRTTSYSTPSGAEAANAFLSSPDRPTALVAATDENALGLMAAVAEAGVSIPNDLAIIGFDNTERAAFAVPSLSSVGQRFDEVGAFAGRLALSILAGEKVRDGAHHVDATYLALRASCGCRADLVDVGPGGQAHPIPTPRPLVRANTNRTLLTLLGGQEDTVSNVATVVGLLDTMLAADDEPPDDDVRDLMRALTVLSGSMEKLQQVAAVLNEYARQVAVCDSNQKSAPGTAHVLAILWELEARGYLDRARRLDSSVVEVDSIAGGLLRADGERNRSLAWLAGTHVRAAVLGLWTGTPDDGVLRIEGVHDPEALLDVQTGDETHVRRFPAASLFNAADGATEEMCLVVRVATAEHELGLLALLGRIDVTSVRESYYHWAEMLCWALVGDKLQNAVRASEERYAVAARAANDGLWEWDTNADSVYLSDRCRDLLAVPDGATPTPEALLLSAHPKDQEPVRRALRAAAEQGDVAIEIEFRVVHASGMARWALCRALGVVSDDGVVRRVVGSVSDIDERRTLEEQLRHAALFDPVTGLPNRRLFLDRLETAMRHPHQHSGTWFAVLFLDLDGFKLINDSLGHLVGDELLRTVGQRLRAGLRSVDTAARFGGDEFALLLTNPANTDLLVVARRIQEQIAAPVRLGDQEVSVTASIGIASSQTSYTSAEDVLRDADIAMYQAKEFERGSACLFDPAMHEMALDRLRMRTALAVALEDHQFVVHYQPIVDLDGGPLARFEALVRWQHPKRNLVGPSEFLPAMTGNPTIVALGRQLLDDVCTQVALWRRENHIVNVSVNLSHREFWDPELITTIQTALARHDVPPECVSLEITESVVMTEPDQARRIMGELHALGMTLHMDDFGTGHSSLHMLRTFPVDVLKIDGSFVRDLGIATDTTALVRAIITMSEALGLRVVAECVETAQQAEELRTMGCEAAQGWLYARAMPGTDAGRLLGTVLHGHPLA